MSSICSHLTELGATKSAESSPIKKKFLQHEVEKIEVLYAEQSELSLDLYFHQVIMLLNKLS